MIDRPVTVLVHGAGRMGRAIVETAASDDAIRIAGVVVRRTVPAPLPGAPPSFPDLTSALTASPHAVVLDFSSPAGAAARIRTVAEHGHPLVLGTTGLEADADQAIDDAASRVAIVVAPNTSTGVVLLRQAMRAVAPALSLGWDAGIIDRHHRAKKDAPSGTAKLLERELRDAGAERVDIVSLRQGSVVGEHVVHLAGPDEELILIHRAQSRNAFAAGALLAARFAAQARPGRYGMDDVLRPPAS
jgi:4-hydroxy-tetrahydrodipicolinate reductase